MGLRRDGNKAKIIEQLRLQPIVSIVCKRSNVSTATYYRWRQEDLNFAYAADEAQSEGTTIVNDAIESQLIKQAMEGVPMMIMYYLNNRHPAYNTLKPRRNPNEIAEKQEYQEMIDDFRTKMKDFLDDPDAQPENFPSNDES